MLAIGALLVANCPNAIDPEDVRGVFDERAKRLIVGQAGALAAARSSIETWRHRAAKECEDRVLHLTGPSGTGKTLLAEIIAGTLFNDTWSSEPFGFCGTLKHKFEFRASSARGNRMQRDIDLFENKVANVLKTEPHAVIVLDDVGRAPQAMLDRLGELICPPSGSDSMGSFRGQFEVREGEYVVEEVSAKNALFILTSDFALSRADRHLDYRATEYHAMEQQVRHEFKAHRLRREKEGIRLPHFWFHTTLVGFHPLTADMLGALADLFIDRTIASARGKIDEYMRRRAYKYRWRPEGNVWTEYNRLTEYSFVGGIYCETRRVLKDWLIGAVEQAEGLDTDEAISEQSDAVSSDEQQEGGWQLRMYERRHVSKFLNLLDEQAATFPTVRVPDEGVKWGRKVDQGFDLKWLGSVGSVAVGAAAMAMPVVGIGAGLAAFAGASDYTTPYVTHEVRNDYCLVFKYKPREHDYPRISLVEAPKRGSCAAVK